MKRLRQFLTPLLVVLFCCTFACKVSDDSVAAAQQMTRTSAALHDYYGAISSSLSDTIALYELNQALFDAPFDTSVRNEIEQTRSQIMRRKEVAECLAKLAGSMTALTRSNAASDVSSAATALGNELSRIKALPQGSPVPDALGKAGSFLIQFVQQHEEKKAARAMDDTLAALVELFANEKPIYDSIARQHASLANTVAASLIRRQMVDPTPLLQPALTPFNLVATAPNERAQSTLRNLALSRLDAAAEASDKRGAEASAAMLEALQEMSSRVHLVATEKPMPIRGTPLSLQVVESWVASLI